MQGVPAEIGGPRQAGAINRIQFSYYPLTDTMADLLESIQIETAPNPTASVIWLHGLGADGADFVPIVRELDLSGCPGIRFIFPHAPTMPVTINNGYVMRAWYDILGMDLVKREDEAGLRKSQQAVEKLIAQEKSRGIAADRIVLAGFSQGCAMTLQTGLRHPEKLAGLLCLSGYLPIHTTVEAERHPENQGTPIFMAHGRTDSVVPIDRAQRSRDLLNAHGYQVEWHEYMMPHSVCAEEVADISAWLRRVLS
ncbi:MAG: carboxylesterase protein [Noviherbaspirillum sp.]|nr:carboxylesterase protein [Noviherbaspirillum sp.]